MPIPVFGFLALTSGSYEGAVIRDMRLANTLHRRGFKVVVYWMMETNGELVDPGITQRILVRGLRYWRGRPSNLIERLGRSMEIFPPRRRRRFVQQHPRFAASLLGNFVASMVNGSDAPVVARLENFMARDGVTHLLPTFVMTCPIALIAKQRGRHPFDYLATFQGEEIFANYARGQLDEYYAQLRRCAAASPWAAVVVSDDYALRVRDEMGIDPQRLTRIYPGIEMPALGTKPDFGLLKEKMPGLNPDLPIVSYFGRQDAEKGIDLLLYATRILRQRGVELQLVICGGSSFGWGYQDVCRDIADHLRLDVFSKRRVTDDLRAALYAHSRCVVYPSIHREPFGMVVAEAMSHGTPAIVPDYGGVAEIVGMPPDAGGLTFEAWNTQDLAEQMHRLLTDQALHASLAAHARKMAEKFSVDAMADGVLGHLGLHSHAQ